jgi:hypothetical protein
MTAQTKVITVGFLLHENFVTLRFGLFVCLQLR